MTRLNLPRLRPRDSHEPHRTASPLELFFDLVFVVAVALASSNLHHFQSENHFDTGIVRYLMVFFAIWWAWMNFTWFASAYDSDDWLYRVLTLVQMAGALVVAAGMPDMMNELDFTVVFAGYIVMRLAMVCQWLRAAQGDPERRTTALRYAGGITVVQLLWVAFQVVPESLVIPAFVAGVAFELAVPVYAERASTTPWHAHHIAERYGLFTIIVLGESILASSNSIIEAIDEVEAKGDLLLLAITAFVIVASMWWIYFAFPQHHRLRSLRTAITWGYGHYLVFASAAAVSAGIEVAVDYDTHHTGLDAGRAAATLCVPVAVFIAVAWFLMIRTENDPSINVVMPLTAVLILIAVFLPYSLQIAALLVVGLVVLIAVRGGHVAHGMRSHPARQE